MAVQGLSISKEEIEKFSKQADTWWDVNGPFKPLHAFNPIRLAYMKERITQHFNVSAKDKPYSGLSFLDVGCGGGLLSEPIARLGAEVTAIDASEKNIAIASIHAENMGLDINYQAISAEQLLETHKQYDVVLAMEVIEHVADVQSFMDACSGLVKPGGLLFVATLNRTIKSFVCAIVGAEYVLKWLPKGTHQWEKFLRPSEIVSYVDPSNFDLMNVQGFDYSLLSRQWSFGTRAEVNYAMCFRRHP